MGDNGPVFSSPPPNTPNWVRTTTTPPTSEERPAPLVLPTLPPGPPLLTVPLAAPPVCPAITALPPAANLASNFNVDAGAAINYLFSQKSADDNGAKGRIEINNNYLTAIEKSPYTEEDDEEKMRVRSIIFEDRCIQWLCRRTEGKKNIHFLVDPNFGSPNPYWGANIALILSNTIDNPTLLEKLLMLLKNLLKNGNGASPLVRIILQILKKILDKKDLSKKLDELKKTESTATSDNLLKIVNEIVKDSNLSQAIIAAGIPADAKEELYAALHEYYSESGNPDAVLLAELDFARASLTVDLAKQKKLVEEASKKLSVIFNDTKEYRKQISSRLDFRRKEYKSPPSEVDKEFVRSLTKARRLEVQLLLLTAGQGSLSPAQKAAKQLTAVDKLFVLHGQPAFSQKGDLIDASNPKKPVKMDVMELLAAKRLLADTLIHLADSNAAEQEKARIVVRLTGQSPSSCQASAALLACARALLDQVAEWRQAYDAKNPEVTDPWMADLSNTVISRVEIQRAAGKVLPPPLFEEVKTVFNNPSAKQDDKLALAKSIALLYLVLPKKNPQYAHLAKEAFEKLEKSGDPRVAAQAQFWQGKLVVVDAEKDSDKLTKGRQLLEAAIKSKKLNADDANEAHKAHGECLARQAFISLDNIEKKNYDDELKKAKEELEAAANSNSQYAKNSALAWLAKIALVEAKFEGTNVLAKALDNINSALESGVLKRKELSFAIQAKADILMAKDHDFDGAIALYNAVPQKDEIIQLGLLEAQCRQNNDYKNLLEKGSNKQFLIRIFTEEKDLAERALGLVLEAHEAEPAWIENLPYLANYLLQSAAGKTIPEKPVLATQLTQIVKVFVDVEKLAVSRESRGEILLKTAKMYLDRDQFEVARNLLDQAKGAFIDNTPGKHNYDLTYAALNLREKDSDSAAEAALNVADNVLNNDKKIDDSWTRTSVINLKLEALSALEENKRLKEAISQAEGVIVKLPNRASEAKFYIQLKIVEARMQLKDFKSAETLAKAILADTKNNPRYKKITAQSRFKLGEIHRYGKGTENHAQANIDYALALTAAQDDARMTAIIRAGQAQLAEAEGDREEAKKRLEEIGPGETEMPAYLRRDVGATRAGLKDPVVTTTARGYVPLPEDAAAASGQGEQQEELLLTFPVYEYQNKRGHSVSFAPRLSLLRSHTPTVDLYSSFTGFGANYRFNPKAAFGVLSIAGGLDVRTGSLIGRYSPDAMLSFFGQPNIRAFLVVWNKWFTAEYYGSSTWDREFHSHIASLMLNLAHTKVPLLRDIRTGLDYSDDAFSYLGNPRRRYLVSLALKIATDFGLLTGWFPKNIFKIFASASVPIHSRMEAETPIGNGKTVMLVDRTGPRPGRGRFEAGVSVVLDQFGVPITLSAQAAYDRQFSHRNPVSEKERDFESLVWEARLSLNVLSLIELLFPSEQKPTPMPLR